MIEETNEYRYIAYTEGSNSAIGYGSKAVLALRKADSIDSNASIHVIDAGTCGYEIWNRKLGLSEAEQLISNNIELKFRTQSE